ncbi:PorP/SprF family type IX secretion system membrane protein [Paracrocinitomix mangrovi]|uniref:PorP/SprF family type IX secretion system membrane protein n=1 Tax=Paracrocinitomix mangrovi TaxID=2862509 RepID=UPI001C8E61AD|nr:PorP/SprF family type IX secretion system membrane protein [Paracrocinitomix mangrovi]UKN00827.1 PorP/SprF family type IX secretion system membrane protein [Paracrocinitomix mangrovi]
MKRILALLTVLIAVGVQGQNQFHIGQYAIHQPFINPASIGTFENINMALIYKNQWVGFDGAPHLGGVNYNMPLGKKQKHFIGVNAIMDRVGINTSTDISASYAYKIKTGQNSRLIFGVSSSLNLVKADLEDINTIDPNDPLYTNNTPTFALPNFKFGSYFYRNNFYVGFVIPNILQNRVVEYNGGPKGEVKFNAANMHYYLHAGYKWRIKDKHDLVFSTLVKEVSGSPLQIDFNINTMFKDRFGIGVSYRSSNEVMANMQIYIVPQLMLSYGYEYGFSALNDFYSGTHEVMMVYRLGATSGAIAFPRIY